MLSAGPKSGFGQQAQYKYAWSLFKQGRDEEGNSAFLVLLDGLLAGPEGARPDAELSRAERELADDALRALAITFAAGDGPAALQAALDAHGPVPYAALLYAALGDLYVEKERYQDGAEAYRAFARREPMNPQAPLLLVRATEAYAKGGFASLVLDGKRQLALEYGPSSAFWAAQAGAVDPAVSVAVQSSLLELAQHHHALAQKGGAAGERDEAVRWYREYLAGFDDTPQAPGTRLLLADLLFEGRSFAAAAVEYERTAYGYAAHPEAARAGYAALVAWADAETEAAPAGRAELAQRAIESSLRFADTFPTHPETAGVLTRTAKALFDADDRERAESVAQRVLASRDARRRGAAAAWRGPCSRTRISIPGATSRRSAPTANSRAACRRAIRCRARPPSASRRRCTGRPRRSRPQAISWARCRSSVASPSSRRPRRPARPRSSTQRRSSSAQASGRRRRACSRASAAITRATPCRPR